VSETAEDAGTKKTGTTSSTWVEIASDAECETGSCAVSASAECSNLDGEDGNDTVTGANMVTVRDEYTQPQLQSVSASSSDAILLRGQSTGMGSESETANEEKTLSERRRRSSERSGSSRSAEVSPKRQKFQRESSSGDHSEEDVASRRQMSV